MKNTDSEVKAGKRRYTEVDIARGIGILFVVLGHSIKQTEVSAGWIRVLTYIIYSFHMPLFFCLSGFVSAKILQMNRQERKRFTLSRARRLLIPYFTVGLIYIPVKLALSGQWMSVWYYIVFLDDRPEITNRNLTQVFDSFGMDEGDLCIANWVGKAGACTIKHDEEGRAKVGYFIKKSRQAELPPWEGDAPKLKGGFEDVPQDDIPF